MRATTGTDPLPEFVAPQLATLVSEPPSRGRYFIEQKFDGYRALGRIDQRPPPRGRPSQRRPEAAAAPPVRLYTRAGNDWTHKLGTLARALGELGVETAMVDGEVVVLGEDGRSDFQALQNSLDGRDDAPLVYYLFDLLYLNGYDLRGAPLRQRKELLRELLAHNPQPRLRYSEHLEGDAGAFLDQQCRKHAEGIVCKDPEGPYRSTRSADWLKVKCKHRQEFVIVGYTDPKRTREHLGALLLGVHEDEGRDGRQRRGRSEPRLRYVGRVGTGFGRELLYDLKTRLMALRVDEPPVIDPPRAAGITWVAPRLVAEVEFSGFTADHIVRHASFQGLRADKPAREVVLEEPTSPSRADGRMRRGRRRPPTDASSIGT